METTEVKLSKHLSAAVNAIQKEIDKKQNYVNKLREKVENDEHQIGILCGEINALEEQITKLKGE